MITFVNRFDVHGSPAEFERVFDRTSLFFSAQPGFLRHRLLRHADQPGKYVNVAEWESRTAFEQALRQPEFASHARDLRELSTSDPQLYVSALERSEPQRPHA
ncbi:antibiotic biosynthesis monooxygenase family protein [Streptomyces sp. NPDC004596]|uniref:antibiotic biosynthesis monooxygenase family protein n=1 Tax=Streptomyces sp. DSM 118148 TaxID=3448667 RepID=UPI00403FEE71